MSIASRVRLVAVGLFVLGCGSSVTTIEPTPDAGVTTADVAPDVRSTPADVATTDVFIATDRVAPPPCALPLGGTCPAGQTCPAGDHCNDCTCPAGGGTATCTARPCAFDAGPGGCDSSRDCRGGQTCRFTTPGCGMLGECGAIPDCAALVAYCTCTGETVMDCPGATSVVWVARGACAADAGTAVDVPVSPDAAVCAGAHLGRGGGYCAAPDDGSLPVTCCTDWNCDTRLVACNRIPPTCPPGEVATAAGACYGPCVPATHCALMDCNAGCPPGWSCDASIGRCRNVR